MLKGLLKIFGGRTAGPTGGKADMPGEAQQAAAAATANPPAASGGIDQKAINAAIDAAIIAAIKPLNEQIGTLTQQLADAKAKAPAGISAADVDKLLSEKLAASQQSAEAKAAREKFVGEKLKDLPAVYQGQLGNDPGKWPAEEQAIRAQFQADLKAAGVTAKPVDGGAGTGGAAKAGTAVDTSKLSGQSLIEIGLKDSKPIGPAAAAAAQQAAK